MIRPRFTRRDLRLGSGLELFTCIVTHLPNHALGLVSVAAAERALRTAVLVWQSLPGTVLLYGAAAVHVSLAFAQTHLASDVVFMSTHVAETVSGVVVRGTHVKGVPFRDLSGTFYAASGSRGAAEMPKAHRATRPMKKSALYSHSVRAHRPERPGVAADAQASAPVETPAPPATPARKGVRGFVARFERPLLVIAGALFAAALAAIHAAYTPHARQITQEDIDAAVLHTLETAQIPSAASRAYEAVRRSVVRVRGTGHDKDKDGKPTEGIGSGVVIVDTGVILTNMHVVAGAEKVTVEFDDGLESEATVIGVRPEHDLAVLQASKLPDDLPAATLRSTANLNPGDEVIAVGFPFGIGPSVSTGVISGLRRDYYSPQGKRLLTNLIQFDAAANPGNSGGPLVTADGEVVGIVTGILNPTEQRVFIGIGFAVPIENAAAAFGLSPF